MIKDYHTHPQIIQHPNSIDDFVNVALQNGVQELCITDHMPLSVSSAADRIPFDKVEDYCVCARTIADKYKDKISIKLGMEIDFHPTLQQEIEQVLKRGDFDFLVGSVHLHAYEHLNVFNTLHTINKYAEEIYKNSILAAESGYFNAIAHVDMYRWIFSNPTRFPLKDDGFDEKNHFQLIDDLLCAIKKNNLLLEINPHFALSKKDFSCIYPSANIVKMALDKGIRFSYGSDAHTSQDVGAMLNEIRNDKLYGKALKTWEKE
jgi:histidinol-phosphatase (PHP family)